MLTILVLLLLGHTAYTVTVVAIVVVRRIDVRRVEVEVVGVVRIRVRPRRPEVAVRPLIVQIAPLLTLPLRTNHKGLARSLRREYRLTVYRNRW